MSHSSPCRAADSVTMTMMGEIPAMPTGACKVDPAGRVRIDAVCFDPLTLAGTVEHLMAELGQGRGGWVITANLDHLVRARRDPDYRAMLAEADLVVADGMPLIWASRLQGTPLPERVAGSSMVEPLSERAAHLGYSIFLLGGNPGIAEQAGGILQKNYPGLRLAGTYCPPMGFEEDPAQMRAIEGFLRESRPDIVLVALGSPKQELLIRRLRADFSGTWWLGIGISLSFLAGEVVRAPSWMQRLGLEWAHRLWQEPRRLAKRYLVYGLPFAVRLMVVSLLRRIRPGGPGQRD